MSGNKMTKDTVPEGFTVALALVDLLPCIFFGGTGILLGVLMGSIFVEICAALVFLSGLCKVIWKIIAAVSKKNIWPLFVQMRIVMPLAFTALLVGVIVTAVTGKSSLSPTSFLVFPQLIFFIFGFIGMAAMVVCAIKLDSADAKSNWIEQIVNSFAQACFFVGMLSILI